MAIRLDYDLNQKVANINPDLNWFSEVGGIYPGAISYWTQKGFDKYKDSGLYDLHKKIFHPKDIFITEIDIDENSAYVLYKDEVQIIINQK